MRLNNQLSHFNNNCSQYCIQKKQMKFLNEKNKCIQNCLNEENNQFEYDNICYPSCPIRTHNSSDNPFLCEKDILICNIKCEKCTYDSNDINLCTNCNTKENYFPLFNDLSNINGFINCYNYEIEGYYLDINQKIYKNCFSGCKNCEEFAGEDKNKCNNCNYKKNEFDFYFCFEICDYNYNKL